LYLKGVDLSEFTETQRKLISKSLKDVKELNLNETKITQALLIKLLEEATLSQDSNLSKVKEKQAKIIAFLKGATSLEVLDISYSNFGY
jgi:hypothetical protein